MDAVYPSGPNDSWSDDDSCDEDNDEPNKIHEMGADGTASAVGSSEVVVAPSSMLDQSTITMDSNIACIIAWFLGQILTF